MNGLGFAYPWMLGALVLAALPLLFHGVRQHAHPALNLWPRDWASTAMQLGLRLLAALAIALLVLAASGPFLGGGTVSRTGHGAQIVIVFDRSGSMSESLAGSFDENQGGESKLAAARRLLSEFMRQRPGDMFGMVAFASSPMSVAPLGEDRDMAEAALSSAQARSMGFTTVGRAVAMALDYFRDRPYTATRVVLLVSDGGAEILGPDREILQTLFAARRATLIWLYTRGAREDSVIHDVDPSSQSLGMHEFFSQMGTPYQVFEATSPADVKRAIDELGTLTNLPTQYEERLPRRDLAGTLYLLSLPLLALMALAKAWEVRLWVS
jgi:mxaC protein